MLQAMSTRASSRNLAAPPSPSHPAVLSISWLLQGQHEPVRRSLQWSAASSPARPGGQQLVFDDPPGGSVFEDQENQPGAGGPMGAGMARLESLGISLDRWECFMGNEGWGFCPLSCIPQFEGFQCPATQPSETRCILLNGL